jgi:hypothetical protein
MRSCILFAGAVLGLAVAACGGSASPIQPVVVNGASTVTFTPTQVQASRYPNACGVANPPYADGDLFSLEAIGKGAGDPRSTCTRST